MSKLVYIAGPYSAYTENDLVENIMRVRVVAVRLWEAGLVPVVPHLNSAFMGGATSYERFIEGDLEILRAIHCAGGCILMTGKWSESKGCLVEFEEARKLGMRTFQTAEELIEEWLIWDHY